MQQVHIYVSGHQNNNCARDGPVHSIDVKNITLQIKNIKNMHKNVKTTVSIEIRSTVNTNQIKSIIMLQNTRSVQEMESLPMRNASYL